MESIRTYNKHLIMFREKSKIKVLELFGGIGAPRKALEVALIMK